MLTFFLFLVSTHERHSLLSIARPTFLARLGIIGKFDINLQKLGNVIEDPTRIPC